MEIAKRKSFQGVNPRWFLEAAAKEGSECSLNDVINFFLHVINLFLSIDA